MPVLLTDDQIAATRARIVDIAMRHAVERGVDGVSMHGVARELGWTATALYRYFASKDALLTAARVAALNDLSERLEAVMAGPGDVWDKSRASGAAYVDFAFTRPDAYQMIFAMKQPDVAAYPELQAAQARSRRAMVAYVEAMVEAGAIEADPHLLGHVFWGGLHGLVTLHMAGHLGAQGQPDFETIRHEMVRRIVQAVRTER